MTKHTQDAHFADQTVGQLCKVSIWYAPKYSLLLSLYTNTQCYACLFVSTCTRIFDLLSTCLHMYVVWLFVCLFVCLFAYTW